MPSALTTNIKIKPGGGLSPGGGNPFGSGPAGSEDWPPGWTGDNAVETEKYRIGMWVALASILMLFISLTSAYIVRGVPALSGGGDTDWLPLDMPRVLWFTTGVLLLSSVSIELARRALKRNEYAGFKRWISLTTLFGVAFLVGQLMAWRQLAGQGVFINSHPHSSFFYLLTSLHGVHLLGGVIALGYVTVAALRMRIGFKRRTAVDVTAIYWHFMDGLWIYLFGLLFFFR